MIQVMCPNCKAINKLPKKDSYKKANCGKCGYNLLASEPIEVKSEEEFNKIISNVNLPIIIDFWAVWCGPCQMFAPTFKETSKHFSLKAQFVKVNTEELPQVAAKFGIRSIPTIVAIKNSNEVDRVMGALPEADFRLWVSRFI